MRQLAALLLAAALPLAACRHAPPPPSPLSLRLRSTDGAEAPLERYRGRVLLVTFFATWCLPCLAEAPVLEKLERDLAPDGFSVVAIGMDLEGERVLAPFARSVGASYAVLVADDAMRDGRSPFGLIRQIPSSFLFDRDGALVAAWSGPADPTALEKLAARLTSRGR